MISPEDFSYGTLSLVLAIYFPFLCITNASALPCGLFMPSILIGCCFGGIEGKLLQHMYPDYFSHPGSFALMGAVAMLGGVQRSTISLCVIMLEGTGRLDFLLPIIFTTVFARYTGDLCSEHGIYEHLLQIKKIPFLERHQHRDYVLHSVDEVMAQPVRTVKTAEQVGVLIETLRSCNHNAFPVVKDNGSLVGIILRTQIEMLVNKKKFIATPTFAEASTVPTQTFVEDMMVPNYAARKPTEFHDGGYEAWQPEERRYIDVARAMNIAPCSVLKSCPLSRALALFTTMGLRHLVVTDDRNVATGMVTRKDLCIFEEERHHAAKEQ
jgi:chloride channel 7